MKKLAAILLAGVLALTVFAGCGGKDVGNADNGNKETLVVGLDPEFPPMGFKENNDEIVGFDIDLANAVAEEMGVQMKFQPIDWSSKELEIDTGRIDMIWNGFSITPEREEALLLTKPYLNNNMIVVTLKDSAISKVDDLEGKKVVLQKESSALDAFQEAPVSEKVADLTQLSSNVDCFQDLENGRAEAMVVDETVAKYYLNLHKDKFKILDESLGAEKYAIGLKKGNDELKEKLEAAITKVVESGKAKEISEKWFGEDIVAWNK